MIRPEKRYLLHAAIVLLTLLSLLSSCRGIDPEAPLAQAVEISDINIAFSSKTVGTGSYKDTTFRIALYNSATHNFSGYDGTYCLPNPDKDQRWLTPCKVIDTTGAYDTSAADPEATINGLQAVDGAYYQTVASPAVALRSPKKGITGYYYDRERTPGEKTLYISDGIYVVVSGLTIQGGNLFNVSDSVRLKERRARLKISVSCGDDIESAIIKEVKLTNILSKGYYLPVDQEFDYEESYLVDVPVKTFSPAITLYKIDNPGAGQHKTDTCEVQPYVLSMDYSKVDEYSRPKFALPEITLLLGEEGDNSVNIPVAYNLLPENIYTCHITINSTFVQVHLSVLDWDNGADVNTGNESYLQRPSTFTVPIWDSGTSGTDGDTSIHDSAW